MLVVVVIHDDEFPAGVDVARDLIARQRPDLLDLHIDPVGAGTDNTMYRVGTGLLMRIPRTRGTESALRKELRWLPRLAPRLGRRVPEPVFAGEPSSGFPFAWALYRWIDGEPAGPDSVEDWTTYGRDLAAFVRELHSCDLLGARRAGELEWYRGGLLQEHDGWLADCLTAIRGLPTGLDVDALQEIWTAASRLPPPRGRHVWLHGDLKPTNVLVRSGRITAVIDFGGLSIGHPDAEHAPIWDLPAAARGAYRVALGLDDAIWMRARAWSLLVAASGIPYYWETYPEFVTECQQRLRAIAADA